MAKTTISWCTYTNNLWWGCTRKHTGCIHCYAETLAKRVGNDVWGEDKPRRMIESAFPQLARWQAKAELEGRHEGVFTGSMMDIFEDSKPLVDHRGTPIEGDVTATLREKYLWRAILETPNLTHLLLTKRPENIAFFVPQHWLDRGAPDNVMFGYSPANQPTLDRWVSYLLRVPGRRFLSYEPAVGPISLSRYLDRLHWVIVGGESGAEARPFNPDWARDVVNQCHEAGVPVLVKQMGALWAKQMGIFRQDPKGEDMQYWPEDLRVKEFPAGVDAPEQKEKSHEGPAKGAVNG